MSEFNIVQPDKANRLWFNPYQSSRLHCQVWNLLMIASATGLLIIIYYIRRKRRNARKQLYSNNKLNFKGGKKEKTVIPDFSFVHIIFILLYYRPNRN